MADLHIFSNDTVADADQVMDNFNELDRRSLWAQLFLPADPQPVGLFFGYGAGRVRTSDGSVIEEAAGTVALTDDAANYVEVNSTGEVSVNTTGFDDGRKPLAIVTVSSGVKTITDQRVGFDFSAGGGGGGSLAWEGEWVTATSYSVGDIVQNGSPVSSYRALTNHTSGATTEPGVGASWATNWEIIAEAGGQGPQGEAGLPGGSLDWKGDWANATGYAVDDAVQDGTRKSSYRCKSAHTSSSTNRPGLGASWATYWTLIAQAGEAGAAGATGATGPAGANGINGVVWQGAWDSLTTYGENDGVSHDGSSYVCTASNTNQEPPNGAYWDLLAAEGGIGPTGPAGDAMDWQGDWQDAAGYAVNDAVQHGSPKSSYRCYTAHTAGDDNEPGVGVDWEDYWTLFAGAGGSAVESLDDLDDVVITTPTSDQVLKYNGSNWINGAAPSAGHVIADEGTPLTARATLDFQGAGVTVTDDGSSKTIVTIPGLAAGLGIAGIVEAHLTGSQSIPNNTATAIQFSATDTDPADYWDSGSPTKFVVPAGYAGRHDIKALVEFPTNSTGNRSIAIYVNGSDITGLLRYAAAPSNDTNIGISWTADLEEGDEVEIYVAQTSGGALNIQPQTAVSITRLAVVDEINAQQIGGIPVVGTPTDGQVLAYNSTANEYQPVDQSGGGGGSVDEKVLRYRIYRYS